MPNELYLSPNPPDEEHWLCEEFPLTDSNALDVVCRPGYRYIRTTVYDNPWTWIRLHSRLEAGLSAGHVLASPIHRGPPRFVGRRDAGYKGYFARGPSPSG